jgi:hypothetical protein
MTESFDIRLAIERVLLRLSKLLEAPLPSLPFGVRRRRGAPSFEAFVSDLGDSSGLDMEIAEKVFRFFAFTCPGSNYPIMGSDRLLDIFADYEDINIVLLDIADDIGIRVRSPNEFSGHRTLVTVRDVVALLSGERRDGIMGTELLELRGRP